MTTTQTGSDVNATPESDRAERRLRRVLALDALVGLATAAGFLASTDTYHRATGLPSDLIRGAAFVLLVYVAALTWAAARRPLQRRTIGVIIAANVLYVLVSIFVAATVEATALGVAYVLGQALVVVALATAETRNLRLVQR